MRRAGSVQYYPSLKRKRRLFAYASGSDMVRLRLVLALCLLFSGTACQPNPDPTHLQEAPNTAQKEPLMFEDVTPSSGVDFTYRNGEETEHVAILETLGGGAALIDYDGDGLLDIFLTGGGLFNG